MISWVDSVKNSIQHRVRKDRNILHTIKKKEGQLNSTYLAWELCSKNTLLNERQTCRGEEEKEVSSYWMTFRKQEWNLKAEALRHIQWIQRSETTVPQEQKHS